MEETVSMPHKLSLNGRKNLTLTGVSEVISFDDTTVALKTGMGLLTVHGQGLQLKNLSLDGGQVAVDGTVSALIYEEAKPAGGLRRLFR